MDWMDKKDTLLPHGIVLDDDLLFFWGKSFGFRGL